MGWCEGPLRQKVSVYRFMFCPTQPHAVPAHSFPARRPVPESAGQAYGRRPYVLRRDRVDELGGFRSCRPVPRRTYIEIGCTHVDHLFFFTWEHGFLGFWDPWCEMSPGHLAPTVLKYHFPVRNRLRVTVGCSTLTLQPGGRMFGQGKMWRCDNSGAHHTMFTVSGRRAYELIGIGVIIREFEKRVGEFRPGL